MHPRSGTAALAATALIALAALGGCSSDDSPDVGPTKAAGKAPTKKPVAGVLTHEGYGAVRLGMSVAALRATGAVRLGKLSKAHEGCAAQFRMRSDPGVSGYVSWDHGVVAIFASKRTRTTEGIHEGSASAAALEAYPQARASVNGWFARISPKGVQPEVDYRFAFTHAHHGPVTNLMIQLDTQDCYE